MIYISVGSALLPVMHPEIFLILSITHLVHSTFNQTTSNSTWDGNSVQPNKSGTFCYFPAANQTNATFCTGGHSSDTTYQPVLNIHLHLSQGWSIAYYSANNVLLGNQDYPVIAGTGTRECLSGQAGDGTYQTLCQGIDYNNNIAEAGSFCQVKLGQTYVSDGCYVAMPNTTSTTTVPASTSSTSTTSPLTASPSPSSLSSGNQGRRDVVATIVIPIVIGIMGLIGAWTGAYCRSAWLSSIQQVVL